jgi:hypothetical protein
MDLGPISRIIMRYGIGYLAGSEIGETLAMDQDAVLLLSLALGAFVESVYAMAKRKGWAT